MVGVLVDRGELLVELLRKVLIRMSLLVEIAGTLSVLKVQIIRKVPTWTDRAVCTDRTLNKKGRLFAGYSAGTTPTACGLSLSQSAKRVPSLTNFEGPEGCVPILMTKQKCGSTTVFTLIYTN